MYRERQTERLGERETDREIPKPFLSNEPKLA